MDERAILDAGLEQFDALMEKIGGCTDGGCIIVRPKGMHTNGGCRCYGDKMKMQRYVHATTQLRFAIRNALAALQESRDV